MEQKIVYVVSEYGGEYEDKWERVVAVCASNDKALEIKKDLELQHNQTCAITREEYEHLLDEVAVYEEENDMYFETDLDGIMQLFPGVYKEEDLKQADSIYFDYSDWEGVFIEEIEYYD